MEKKEIEISEVTANPSDKKIIQKVGFNLISDMQLSLSADLGSTTMSIETLTNLRQGEVVKLNQKVDDLIALKSNGQILAYGRLVAEGDHFAIEIEQVVSLDE